LSQNFANYLLTQSGTNVATMNPLSDLTTPLSQANSAANNTLATAGSGSSGNSGSSGQAYAWGGTGGAGSGSAAALIGGGSGGAAGNQSQFGGTGIVIITWIHPL
jgi:hypothetical protein